MNARDNHELARQLSKELSRLAGGQDSGTSPEEVQAGDQPTEETSRLPSASRFNQPLPPDPHALSILERRGLFVALAAGTKRHLGREPTATELAQLVDTVSRARQVVAWEKAILRGAEVHWEGSDWRFETSPGDGRAPGDSGLRHVA